MFFPGHGALPARSGTGHSSAQAAQPQARLTPPFCVMALLRTGLACPRREVRVSPPARRTEHRPGAGSDGRAQSLSPLPVAARRDTGVGGSDCCEGTRRDRISCFVLVDRKARQGPGQQNYCPRRTVQRENSLTSSRLAASEPPHQSNVWLPVA